jgi:HAE1 family hydrophobic/amphiphilic exporter-1
MSDGISAPFIRYPIGTSLLMAGILFVGLVAYPLLPVAAAAGRLHHPDHRQPARRQSETIATSVAALERQFAVTSRRPRRLSRHRFGDDQFDLNRSIDGAANDVRPQSTPRRRYEEPAAADLPRSTRRIRRSCCYRQHQTRCR